MTDLRHEIESRLVAALAPESIDLYDESAEHAGHSGNPGGAGHFHLQIVSAQFSGLSRIQRQRLIYDALDGLIPHSIHALSIVARSPSEPLV